MPVNNTHKEYDAAVKRWDLVRSIVDNNARHLIRVVDPNDPVRSKQYRDDAILTNFTRLTKIGLTGLVFRKPAEIQLAPGLEYLEEDATGYEFGLEQLAQQVVGEVLETGRYGLLVDYPQVEGNGKAKLKPYAAETMINWRYEEIDGQYIPVMIVLKECIEVMVDGDMFDYQPQDQYRVLLLDKEGNYNQAIYNFEYELVSVVSPVDYTGKPLQYIPFYFIGSENNDSDVDSIPLYDLAVLNLGHYRNSADYEESIFITGQPFLVVNVGDTSQEEFKAANPGGLRFGSRAGLVVSTGGNANLLQANPNQLADVAMTHKEEQAAAIGARLIAKPGGRETAEAARIRSGSQNASLYTITKNVELAFSECLEALAQFMMEVPSDSVFQLNDQFYEEVADPNLLAQEIMMLDKGVMAKSDIRVQLKRLNILDESRTDAEIDSEATPAPVAAVNTTTTNPEGTK